jgi:AcrR family transcriptional regulator
MTASSTTTTPIAIEGRERVLREAHALFIARGYAETSMQQIADAAGMTKAALYYHFRDKEDLFGHVILRQMDRVRRGLAAALAEDGTLRDQLERAARYVFETVRADLGRLMVDFKGHVGAARREAIECQIDLPHDILRPCFERAAAAGELRDVDLDLAVSFYFSMVFAQVKHESLAMERPPAEVAAAIADVLLYGIGNPARTVLTAATEQQTDGA